MWKTTFWEKVSLILYSVVVVVSVYNVFAEPNYWVHWLVLVLVVLCLIFIVFDIRNNNTQGRHNVK